MENDDYLVSARSREEIDAKALKTRGLFHVEEKAFFPLVPIVENEMTRLVPGYELHVEPVTVQTKQVEAYVAVDPPRLVIPVDTYDRACLHDERIRFSLAHEIGHLLMHLEYLKDSTEQLHRVAMKQGESQRNKFIPTNRSAERQADWFAIGLLQPEKIVKLFKSARDLSYVTRVTYHASVIRMFELGLLPEPSDMETKILGRTDRSKWQNGRRG